MTLIERNPSISIANVRCHGTRCKCGRELQPHDARIERERVVLICGNCHQDAVEIEFEGQSVS